MSNFDSFSNPDVYDFNSEVTAEVTEFALLPDGTYPYTVVNVEKEFYEPKEGSKLPPCNMAKITCEVNGGNNGTTRITRSFFWHSSTMWRISQLFISVGLVKKGEKFVPNPDRLLGLTGSCQVVQESYTKNNGGAGTRNEITKYLEPPTQESFGDF